MPVEPDLNFLGAAAYAKSSFSDIDTVTSPALSFTTLKSHGFTHVFPSNRRETLRRAPATPRARRHKTHRPPKVLQPRNGPGYAREPELPFASPSNAQERQF